MPVPSGTRFRYAKSGGVRLAFHDGDVVEAKNMETGKTHTAKEFAADRADKAKSQAAALRGKKK